MMVRVRVKGSPYKAVRVGVLGEVLSRKRIGTAYELLTVRFKDGSVWSFYPDEVELLEEEK